MQGGHGGNQPSIPPPQNKTNTRTRIPQYPLLLLLPRRLLPLPLPLRPLPLPERLQVPVLERLERKGQQPLVGLDGLGERGEDVFEVLFLFFDVGGGGSVVRSGSGGWWGRYDGMLHACMMHGWEQRHATPTHPVVDEDVGGDHQVEGAGGGLWAVVVGGGGVVVCVLFLGKRGGYEVEGQPTEQMKGLYATPRHRHHHV